MTHCKSEKIEPDHQEINILVALFKQGRYAEVETLARAMTVSFPEHVSGWKAVGTALLQQGRAEEALAFLQRASSLSQGDAQLQNNLGNTFSKLRRLSEAEAIYRQAIKLDPGFTEAQYNLGNTLLKLNRLPEAEASYRRVLELKPGFAEAHCILGDILNGQGRLSEAEACYRLALELKPGFAEAHNNLGSILRSLGQFESAVACYRRALEIKPDSIEALNNLGHILYDLGDIDQAIVAYQKVLTIDPQHLGVEAALSLAKLYYLNGSIEQCLSMLDLSRSFDTTTGPTHKNARAYWRYLNSLLADYQKTDREKHQQKDISTLYVVGDSHSMSAHGVIVPFHCQEMCCVAEWIEGCKQWHLGNNKPNRFKCKFENIMEKLPRESRILLLIGEIDCRPDEGIIKAWKKSQKMSLDDVAKTTVVSYVSYVTRVAAKFGHRAIIGGIPAPNNIRLNILDAEAVSYREAMDQFIRLISLVNSTLKNQALAAGMDFLDVYAITDQGGGRASGEWHIDNYHLLPSAITEAFSKCLIASEHHKRPSI